MNPLHTLQPAEQRMATYTFKVVVERDDDCWHAYCPALVEKGAATWGATQEEALENIEDVLKMVVASMREHGEPIVTGASAGSIDVSEEPLVSVTL
jgi:predicted RNase H-like HicB family nuclease